MIQITIQTKKINTKIIQCNTAEKNPNQKSPNARSLVFYDLYSFSIKIVSVLCNQDVFIPQLVSGAVKKHKLHSTHQNSTIIFRARHKLILSINLNFWFWKTKKRKRFSLSRSVFGSRSLKMILFWFVLIDELHVNMFCKITAGFSTNVNSSPPLKLHSSLFKTCLQLVGLL